MSSIKTNSLIVHGTRAVLLAVTACLLMAPRTSVEQQAPRRIEIVAKRFEYIPREITLKKGEPVILVLTSQDVPHGLKFSELNLETDNIKKGTQTELAFTPQKTGTFVGHCSHFCGSGHGSMTLTLHVVE